METKDLLTTNFIKVILSLEKECIISDVVRQTNLSKPTIAQSIFLLESEGIITTKRIRTIRKITLTKKGLYIRESLIKLIDGCDKK